MSPKHSSLFLFHCNVSVEIPRFDFISSLLSLLQDPSNMQSNNLLYNEECYMDPSIQKYDDHHEFNDIHTGYWFRDTHKKMIKHSNHQMLCPLILYIDGVSIDQLGRKSIEPVAFTLGIFNRKTRHSSSAWRVLGYIPDIEKTTHLNHKDLSKEVQLEDRNLKKLHYHQMLQCILSDVHIIQQSNGIKMKLPFMKESKMYIKEVKMYFPIAFVIGDTIGADKLCSRKQNYTPTKLGNTGISRDCNCIYKYSHLHDFKCTFISRELVTNSHPTVRERLGFTKHLFNVFDFLDLGYSMYGINSHSPPECLHQWYLGIITNVVE